MLGWNVGVYTMVARNISDAAVLQDHPSMRGLSVTQLDSLQDGFARGDRIAVWQAGSAGLRWVDELVQSGAAIAAHTDGYPSVFYARAVDVVPRLDAPPEARPVWVSGPDDVVSGEWAGRTVVDRDAAAACTPEQWLLIEAWDES
jgi:hypothetical protein